MALLQVRVRRLGDASEAAPHASAFTASLWSPSGSLKPSVDEPFDTQEAFAAIGRVLVRGFGARVTGVIDGPGEASPTWRRYACRVAAAPTAECRMQIPIRADVKFSRAFTASATLGGGGGNRTDGHVREASDDSLRIS
eukprot:5001312-Prymnesium_polylepis.1